jgi:hypothetical protein
MERIQRKLADSNDGNYSQIDQGAFLLPPRSSNVQVYEGAGFIRAMTEPIVPGSGSDVYRGFDA